MSSPATKNADNKRILLLVSGMSPQILTESLYALAVAPARPEDRFVPDEIHLISTSDGAKHAALSLLEPGKGYFYQLCKEYSLNPAMFCRDHIHVIHNEAGLPLADIRTPGDNEAAADVITDWIRQFTHQTSTTLHVSLAGGRKTMGYYAGYALSLFGRSQDQLSHVLVSEGYENNPDFFYPTRETRVIYDRNGKTLDTAEARVTLAEIPYIRMRDDIPAKLQRGNAGFSETIALARIAEQTPAVKLIAGRHDMIEINGLEVSLNPGLYSFYCWMLVRCKQGLPPLPAPREHDSNKAYAKDLLSLMETIYGASRDFERTREAFRSGMELDFIREKISRIHKELNDQLGKRLAAKFLIENTGPRGYSQYGLALEPDQITLPTDWKLGSRSDEYHER